MQEESITYKRRSRTNQEGGFVPYALRYTWKFLPKAGREDKDGRCSKQNLINRDLLDRALFATKHGYYEGQEPVIE